MSLAISMVIALIITILPARGFVIQKVDSIDATTDLTAEESIALGVQSDVRPLKDENAVENAEILDSVIALTDTKNATDETSTNNYVIADKSAPNIYNETDTVSLQTLRNSTNEAPNLTLDDDSKTQLVGKNHNEPIKIEIITSLINKESINPTQDININDPLVARSLPDFDKDEISSTTESMLTTIDTTNKFEEDTSGYSNYEVYTLPTSQRQLDINTESSSDEIVDDVTSNTKSDIIYTKDGDVMLNEKSETEYQTLEPYSTETSTDEIISTTLPSWKKYKTIKRTRKTTTSAEDTTATSTEDIAMTPTDRSSSITLEGATTSETELLTAENTQKIPEHLIKVSPMSLQDDFIKHILRDEEFTTKIYNENDTINENETTTISWNATELETQTSSPVMNESEAPREKPDTPVIKLEVVSSKRAGYLDNSGTTTSKPEHATTITMMTKEDTNYTDSYGTMYGGEAGYAEFNESHQNKNGTAEASQSQLTDDAFKEELLMEKTLDDNALIKANKEVNTQQEDSTQMPNTRLTDESSRDDKIDKKKMSILYTVSPKYKPLKKLDVQPSKQFVRDPDDNSWRNESINSLGIVFKPKNASKSFTEVLKNKTTEFSTMTNEVNKSDVPDLRVRLEKIAEDRKSKKKKINKFGYMYSDYEENSSESSTPSKEDVTSTTPLTTSISTTEYDLSVNDIWKNKINIFDMPKEEFTTTQKLRKKPFIGDYYDSTDDYDIDYVNLPKIDLKKSTEPFKSRDSVATLPLEHYITHVKNVMTTTPMSTYPPDRQPTVQYFPPTKKTTQKPISTQSNDYDDNFQKRLNLYTYHDPSKSTVPGTQNVMFELQNKPTPKLYSTQSRQPQGSEKSTYISSEPPVNEPEYLSNDANFNKASYVIRHYKDFLNEAAKDSDDDRGSEYLAYTETPLRGVTLSEMTNYDTQHPKDIVNRFVENFNQNSERFKVDFPVLFNNSIVHTKEYEDGRPLASSSAYMKRLYETDNKRTSYITNSRPCGSCEGMNVDLSPAYELHYYVPEQEEKEEVDPHDLTKHYRL